MKKGKRKICLVHIPKTGGRTFYRSIGNCHLHNRGNRHIDYFSLCNLARGLAVKPVFVTILRGPLIRWVSNLNYCIMNPKTAYYHFFRVEHCSLNKILQRCLEEERNVNTMTKMIGGIQSHYRPYACQTKKFSTAEMEDLLEIAKNNLMSLDFVGFTNSIKPLLKKVARALGISGKIKFLKSNVNKKKMFSLSQFDPKLLYELNEYDIKLYEFAQKIKKDKS